MKGIRLSNKMIGALMGNTTSRIVSGEKYEDMIGQSVYVMDDKNVVGKAFVHSIDDIDKTPKGQLFSYRLSFHPLKRQVPYKKPSSEYSFHYDDVQFDDAYAISLEFIKDVKNYNPSELRSDVLTDDWRIVCAWYSSLRKGHKMSLSMEDIENLALSIMKEMMKRGIKTNPESYKEFAKELHDKTVKRIREKKYFIAEFEKTLAPVRSSGVELGEDLQLTQVQDLFKEFKISAPWVQLVGGIVENGHTKNDIDILIREQTPNLPLEFRIARQVPPEIASRLHFLYDAEHNGPFTSYIPLYDKKAELSQYNSVIELEAPPIEDEFMIKPFFHPAGQGLTARKIVQYVTDHEKYVEPFMGAAAVYWVKKPSKFEVLNDINDDYVFMFRAIKSLTDAEIQSLSTDFSWVSDKATWLKTKESVNSNIYESKLHRLWSFTYWSKFSYNGLGWNWSKFKEGKKMKMDYPALRDRMKNTSITKTDYSEVMKAHDSESTFFYIDPPYYAKSDKRYIGNSKGGIGEIDMEQFAKNCGAMKGRTIVSLPKDKQILDLFSNKFEMKKIVCKYGYGWGKAQETYWPIMMNYSVKDIQLGTYAFEEKFELQDFDVDKDLKEDYAEED